VHGFAGGLFGLGALDMQHPSGGRPGRARDRLFDADRAAPPTELAGGRHVPPVRSHR
jgi:hypothetical protein